VKKAAMLLALAALTIASPIVATTEASYKITSVHQIAPNTLHYLISHWTGAGSFEAKMRALEVKVSGKALMLEGPEGKEGREGVQGARGERGDPGNERDDGTRRR
jgi:hypothetical protein